MSQRDHLTRLLHLAVQEQDERARTEITAALQRHVTGWLRESGCAESGLDKVVEEAWSLFWRACTPGRLAMMDHDGAIHHYLRACVQAAAPRLRPPVLPDPAAPDVAATAPPAPRDQREEALTELRFAQGLSAAQICKARPDLFATEDDVWRLARALLGHQPHGD
jgi:hypothetical protein